MAEVEHSPRVLYRVVLTNPPTLADFRSLAARGRPRPATVQPPELWEGVSVFDSLEQATRIAHGRRGRLGTFIARLEVESEQMRVRRTGTTPGHHTIWATAEALLASVRDVTPI